MKWFGGNSGRGVAVPALQGKTLDVGEHRLRVEEHLGDGGFAVIYRVKDVRNNQYYALKHIVMRSPEAKTALKDEAKIMKKLQGHPNIISLFCVAFGQEKEEEQDAFMLMDLCGESLYGYLHRKNFVLSDGEVLDIFQAVCSAVQHLHSQKHPICHRDIKIENVLRHPSGNWVLCDFGSAKGRNKANITPQSSQYEQQEINRNTTPAYRAPEMWDILMGYPIDERADIWALGCMLYLLCYGSLPFTGESQLEVMAGKSGFPQTRPLAFEKAIAAMLHIDVDKRPNIHSILATIEEMKQGLAIAKGSRTLPAQNNVEPRSLSATMKSERFPLSHSSNKPSSMSSQPSMPNVAASNDGLPNSARRAPVNETFPLRAAANETYPIRSPANETYPIRSPGNETYPIRGQANETFPHRYSADAASPRFQKPVGNGKTLDMPIQKSEARRPNTSSTPKLPVSQSPPGNTRSVDSTAQIIDEIKSLKLAVGNLSEQNQLLYSKVMTLEGVVKSQQQVIEDLKAQQQTQVVPTTSTPKPSVEAESISAPVPPTQLSPTPATRRMEVPAIPLTQPPHPTHTHHQSSSVNFSHEHTLSSEDTPRMAQQSTSNAFEPLLSAKAETSNTSKNAGRFGGTFWKNITEISEQQRQVIEEDTSETDDLSADLESKHKRVVSDPPPLDSWHTSGKL